MLSVSGGASVGGIKVVTVDNRGFTPEELVDRAVDKIISVGSNSHPAIREQALAFKEHLRTIILFYMQDAIRQDRATLAQRLRNAGHSDLVALLGD